MLLQLLVGVVDAELLQVVPLETLEAVDVQQACRAAGGTRRVRGQNTRRCPATQEDMLRWDVVPMKLHQVELSAHMLWLMNTVSHSNKLGDRERPDLTTTKAETRQTGSAGQASTEMWT